MSVFEAGVVEGMEKVAVEAGSVGDAYATRISQLGGAGSGREKA